MADARQQSNSTITYQAAPRSNAQTARDAAERFADVGQKVAKAIQDTTPDLRSLAALPDAARGGLQELQQGVTALVEAMVRTNVMATQELLRLYGPSAVAELQQRFAREYLDALMQWTTTLVRVARRTGDRALQPIEQQIERASAAG